jgi:hypothetical protein
VRQLARFLRLERARKETEQGAPRPPGRFDTLETQVDADAGAAPRPSAALERFSPEPEPSLTLDSREDEQPFVRCPGCGVDSLRHAARCRHCDARLDTDEARAFNARVWEAARTARARDEEAASRQRRAFEATAVSTAEQRAFGEALAAEVASRERARLMFGGNWSQAGSGWQRATPAVRMKAVTGALAVALSGVLLLLSRRGSVGFWVGVAGVLAVLLLVKRRR